MLFNVGDIVKVTDEGCQYSTYPSFFTQNFGISPKSEDFSSRYCYNVYIDMVNENEEEYKIVGFGKHITTDKIIYVIEDSNSRIFLIGEDGIDAILRKMTLEEIEKELGYKIKLI